MIVTFSTARYSDIMLFGDIAKQMLHLMGHSGSVPGAILAADVPAALQRLQQGITGVAASPVDDDAENGQPRHIDLKTRALPLVELLQSAISNHSDVMWK